MADNKVNSGLLEFSEDQKVFVALDAETSEVKKAVTIDGDGVETDMLGVQPTGKKEITSTAEVNVASYATAQVVDEDLVAGNIKKDVDILGVVGSYEPEAPASDFSTAEVTLINQLTNSTVKIQAPVKYDFEEDSEYFAGYDIYSEAQQTVTANVILYKNMAAGFLDSTAYITAPTIQCTGGVTFDSSAWSFEITGDGTITVTPSGT